MRGFTILTAIGMSMTSFACGDARVEPKPPTREPAPTSASAAASVAPLDFVYPPDGPLPSLRTGDLAPKEYADSIAARALARHVAGGSETLLVEVPLTDEQLENVDPAREASVVVTIAATASDPRPYSFATQADASATGATPTPTLHLWIRRPAATAGSLTGDVFTASLPGAHPGAHFRFRVDDTRKTIADPKTETRWLQALARHLDDPAGGPRRGPWNAFAANRLRALRPSPAPRAVTAGAAPRPMSAPATPPPKGDLARLMETTTGITSIQEALQHDRGLFLAAARERATLPLAGLKGPALAPHPWKTMTARLKTSAPPEPLAATTPAEFHFTRAADIVALLRVLDHVDTWGTPLARLLSETSIDRDASLRYETELGLRRGPLTRALGPTAIADVAVVGSDPYLLEGSDLTVIFRVKSRAILEPALAGALATAAEGHGAVSAETRTHDGVDVAISRTPDGAVHQQRASVGDFEFVSNSPRALDLVLDTARGKHPKLSDEADFQYMLARDAATRSDVLSFMSDKFVAEVIGPKQKILEARRQIALAELMTPGFAALLFGHMNGKSPATVQDLHQAKLLSASELSHAGGGAIAWKPGGAARSAWGTPAALTPLLDLPRPSQVTEQEREAYARFVQSYQSNWSHYIDPVAVRVALDASRVTVDVRELPLIDHSDYKDVAEFVGDTRIDPGKPPSGMRAVFAVGETSSIRQSLGAGASLFTHRKDVGFDWVADWAMVGVLDRSELAESTAKMLERELPQAPSLDAAAAGATGRRNSMNEMTHLPLYAAIGVRNPVGAVLALTALRSLADEMAPGLVEWSESAKHRGVAIVRVSVNTKKTAGGFFPMPDDFRVHYALVSGALVVAFDEIVVRRLIDERLDGRAPKGLAEQSAGTQLAIDIGGAKDGALFTTLTWLLEMSLLDTGARESRAFAEAVLRGAPERASDPAQVRALAFAYFGAAPAPPDGGAYTLTPDGVRDPVRGTLYAPRWPALPVVGSPVAKVMSALAALRTEIGFDDESGTQAANPMRSLHARATIDLR